MTIRKITLRSGAEVPVLGQGTWAMGESQQRRTQEVAALRAGIELEMTLIDTAEMYANGGAEEVVAEAIAGQRDQVFVVSKVLPENASAAGTIAACERSLKRLKTDRIDLYLLHWRGSVPLVETVSAFEKLMSAGKILDWGVSNFDIDDMKELERVNVTKGAATNQVLYNLTRRGIEYDLMPWCVQRGIPIMAYSPVEQGRLLDHPLLKRIATSHGASPAQVALAWAMRDDGVIAIPKASTRAHVQENRAALDLVLGEQDFSELDRAFAPPSRARSLEML